MKKRLRSRVLAVGMVGTSLLTASWALYGQDKPAAGDLLSRGSKLLEEQQYDQAKKILMDINPDQLPEDQRAKRDELIKQADLGLAKVAPSNETFDNAKAAQDAGQLAQAAKLYDVVIQSPTASPEIKQSARVQVELVHAAQKQKAPEMQALLKDAIAAYDAGRLDEAQAAFYKIETVGTETLDWQDASKPAKYEKLIAEKRVAMAAAPGASNAAAAPGGSTAVGSAAVAKGPSNVDAAAMMLATGPEAAATSTAPASDTDLLGQVIQTREIARQRSLTKYNTAKSAAQQAVTAKDFTVALDQAKDAQAEIEGSKALYSTQDYFQLSRDAGTLVASVTAAKAENDRLAGAQQKAQAGHDELVYQQSVEAKRKAEFDHLMEQADRAAEQQDYATAISLVDMVVKNDPTNYNAKLMKKLLEDRLSFQKVAKTASIRSQQDVKNMQDNAESMIPYNDLMVYPEDWPEISRQRQGEQTQSDSEANRKTRARLEAEVDELSADQQGFEKVIRYLADKMNVNISVNWNALQTAQVDKNTQVSVNLRNVPFRKALSTVLAEVAGGNTNALGYTVDDGVITISTKDELNSAKYQVTRVYDIRDLLVQPDTNISPPSLNLQNLTMNQNVQAGSGGAQSGGSGGLFQDTGSTNGNGQNQRTQDQITQEIIQTIESTVSPDSWRDAGGTIGAMRVLNGQLIVTQTGDSQIAVYNLLQQLREERALQISIEARLLLVSNNFLDDFGLGWNLTIPVGGLGNNVGAVTIANNTFTQASSPSTGIPGSLGAGALGGNALDIAGTILDNWQLSVLLRATQADKRTTTVTAPRVTLFNGQRGFLAVTNQQNYVSSFNQTASSGGINGNAATATNLNVSSLSTGIVLDVEATVSSDRRYVVMNLRPQLASLDGIDTFVVPTQNTGTTTGGTTGGGTTGGTTTGGTTTGGTTTGGTTTGGTSGMAGSGTSSNGSSTSGNTLTQAGGAFVQLPRITTTQLVSMVSVPDGGTLLVGGQKLVGEAEIEVGVPVLSKIPGLNRLFTNRSYTRDERTLLILVRPKIIVQREEELKTFGMNFDATPSAMSAAADHQ